MTQFDAATQAQINATAPQNSTWLSANAGSGKTKVLTERVALLLLHGAKPQNIVCLTYTNAAAVEMQNRLVERLGKWAMLPNHELTKELKKLGHVKDHSPERLDEARTLFAAAIETPGGLRIQTIHSFCSAVMRRFPLEAGVSPLFRELDDRSGASLRSELLRSMTQDQDAGILSDVLANYSGPDFDKLIVALARHREKLDVESELENIRSWYGLTPTIPNQSLAERTISDDDLQDLKKFREALRHIDGGKARQTLSALSEHNLTEADTPLLTTLMSNFLTKAGTVHSHLVPAALKKAQPDLAPRILDLADRVVLAKDEHLAESACSATTALHRFAHKFLQRYDAIKRDRGFLDFDDLIRGTEQLLTNPLVASWVLFKLDGGIDHVLVDEAQDTNPAQWRVIKLLTQNMTESAADGSDRTIFVVGDKKQSIYSFQGAEPDAFDRMKDYYAEFLGQSGLTLNQLSLKHSFRSAPAILEAVDQVFKEVQSSDFMASDHVGFHADLPGRVDIWPGIDAQDSVEALAWTDLSDPPTIESANVLLAEKIALSIQAMIDQEMITDRSGITRKVHGGDFLILVQRRSQLFHQIIAACKRLNLPMAGSDRLKLGGEIAVKDLLALLSFLALPQDSLSLATVLRSPLFGWSEKDLFELSHYRKAPDLWVELVNRAEEFPYTAECLDDLRRKVDFLPPYELLEHILTRWEGRLKLIARLGPEAEEGIDILLNKAREYDASAPASLTGFLAWIEKDETDVKREAETAGKNIRVMTVHGAKGLEAPIVILPDTQERRPPNGEPLVLDTEGNLLWKKNKELAPSNQKAGNDLASSRVKAERLRMLYVAMTRAESWLIVCSAGQNGKGDLGWHGLIDAALTKLNAPEMEMPTGMGRRFSRGKWPEPGKAATESQDQTENNLAPHYLQPIEPPTRPKKPLNPSKIGGEKVVSGGADTGDSDAADKGTAIHLLLERSDWIDHERFDDTAQKILRAEGIVLNDGDLSDALKQARSVISKPEFAYLFQPDVLKEVSFSTPASVNGHDRIHGIIDRLIVRPDSVCVVDFKSNAIIPERPEDIPKGLLDQMRAYYLAAASLYPDRRVECSILWTAAPSLMPIPHNIVTAAMVTPSAS